MLAFRLQALGARVVLADPAGLGDNASGVAAGMLAPAMEAVLDPASADHFALLRDARDAWPALAAELERHGGILDRAGALWVGDEPSQLEVAARLAGVGARTERVTERQAAGLSAGLAAPFGGVFTPEDWRLEPIAMLQALRAAFLSVGGEVEADALVGLKAGAAVFGGGRRREADAVVLATGRLPHGLEIRLGPASLRPIKGQIARSTSLPTGGPSVRADGIYVAPSPSGAVIGATMEPDLADRVVDPEAIAQLRRRASGLFPHLRTASLQGAAGVRAATPDGLPLVGRSGEEGAMLALGARRNGWLLAPLIAEILAGELAGDAPGPWKAALDPVRLSGSTRTSD